MRKLLSLVFGACGLLYGVPSQAEVVCCPENQQCGNVCCPTKGCNEAGTACATEECASGIIDDSGYCCDGYLENGNCVSFCSSGYIENGYNCIECSGSGYGAYDGQCVNCSDYGMGVYDGQCVNCHDYGYVSDGYGYCVSPVCPSGFVPGYDSGTCCGDGYGYVITAVVFDDGNGGWSTPGLSAYHCGCPSGFGFYNDGYECLDPIGYTLLDDIYIYRNGQTIYYSLRNPDPYIGCPQMSDFSMYTINIEWRGDACAYLDTDTGRVGIAYAHNYDPYELGQTVYAEIGYSIIIEDLGGCPEGYNTYESYEGSTVMRCCAPGYTYNPSSGYCLTCSDMGSGYGAYDGQCVDCSAYGMGAYDGQCVNSGYSCMPLNDYSNFSFSEDGYTFSSSCCEATGGYAIYGYAMSSSGLYHGDICCSGGSDTSGLFFDSGSIYPGNYNNPVAAPYMSDCIFHASTSAATETLTAWLNDNGIFPRYEWAEYLRNLRSSEHPSWRIATDPNGYGFCICDGYDAVGGSYAVSQCASACGYGY